jgi:hypothetical protein
VYNLHSRHCYAGKFACMFIQILTGLKWWVCFCNTYFIWNKDNHVKNIYLCHCLTEVGPACVWGFDCIQFLLSSSFNTTVCWGIWYFDSLYMLAKRIDSTKIILEALMRRNKVWCLYHDWIPVTHSIAIQPLFYWWIQN